MQYVFISSVPFFLVSLQHFNSRSCQLVLGAGALQVVGLKTITTKNLGRSQQDRQKCGDTIHCTFKWARTHPKTRVRSQR